MSPLDRAFDRRLTTALHDVPTPPGLRERLLAAMVAAPAADVSSGPTPSASESPFGPAPAAESAPLVLGSTAFESPPFESPALSPLTPAFGSAAARHRRLGRRALIAGAVAASALVGVAGWWSWRPANDSRTEITTLAAGWPGRLSNAWQPLSDAPNGFAAQGLRSAPRGWQWASKIVGRTAVAFDVSRPRLRAALFAIRMAAPQLPVGAPAAPQLTTGGQAIGAWRSAAFVYVLVVDGDERSYRELIGSTATPLAWNRPRAPVGVSPGNTAARSARRVAASPAA